MMPAGKLIYRGLGGEGCLEEYHPVARGRVNILVQ